MRINKYLARYSTISRRKADDLIKKGQVTINGKTAALGDEVSPNDKVKVNNKPIVPSEGMADLYILNKPTGYVVSKEGQGNKTIYDLLPKELSHLNPIGRLDKNSSGLLLLTNDGDLQNQLSHPSFDKNKVYIVKLNHPLSGSQIDTIKNGINIGDDRLSKMKVEETEKTSTYKVTLTEGRNRQIRRTFGVLNLKVLKLHRIQMGDFTLDELGKGKITQLMTDLSDKHKSIYN